MYLNVIPIRKLLTEQLNMIINNSSETYSTFTYNVTKNHVVIGQFEKDGKINDIQVDLLFELIIDKITGKSTINFKSIRWSDYQWFSIEEYLKDRNNCEILHSYIDDPIKFYNKFNIPLNYYTYIIHDDDLINKINSDLDNTFQGRFRLEVPTEDTLHSDYDSFTCYFIINGKISSNCKIQIYITRHRDRNNHIDIFCRLVMDRLTTNNCVHKDKDSISIARDLKLMYNLLKESYDIENGSEDVLEFIKLYEQYAKE